MTCKWFKAVLFLSIIFVFFACTTDVDLCEEYHHPHYATVEYRFNWSPDDVGREDSMLVVASRVVNLWKSSVRVSSTGDPSRGAYLWNAPEIPEPEIPTDEIDEEPSDEDPTDENPTDEDSSDEQSSEDESTGDEQGDETPSGDESGDTPSDDDNQESDDSEYGEGLEVDMSDDEEADGELTQFKLRSGDYKFVAFNRSDEEINYDVVEQYISHDEMPMSELNVIYRTYAKGDSALKYMLPDWTDYNGYGGVDRYMQPSLHAIYYDTISVRSLRSNGLYQITFNNIHKLTQHITLEFNIKKVTYNQPFIIDSVFVEMAGIPCAINLSTGYIDITKTKKMMFKAAFDQDTETNSRVACMATMDVPSIVQSASDDVYMGPGIMQVMICCSAPHPDDPTRRLSKKFQGIINLYHTLGEAQLIRITDDGQHALRNKEEAHLFIDADMTVDGDQVIESTDDNAGLDIWRKEGSQPIIVDI